MGGKGGLGFFFVCMYIYIGSYMIKSITVDRQWKIRGKYHSYIYGVYATLKEANVAWKNIPRITQHLYIMTETWETMIKDRR